MSDIEGALVSAKGGKYGRIIGVAPDLSWLEMEWVLPMGTLPKSRTRYTVKEILEEDFQVMTDTGWEKARNVVVKTEATLPLGLVEELKQILEGATKSKKTRTQQLAPSGDHDPFKYRDVLGKGPLKRVRRKKNKYNCRCSNYKCRCVGPKGKAKIVEIDRGYRRRYNRAFLDELQGRSTRALSTLRKQSARRRRKPKTD